MRGANGSPAGRKQNVGGGRWSGRGCRWPEADHAEVRNSRLAAETGACEGQVSRSHCLKPTRNNERLALSSRYVRSLALP